MKRLLIVMVLIVVMGIITPKCPIDEGSAYFTGRTQVDVSGAVLKEYKCYTYGHLFWSPR
jgi:hypothetical protein